METITQEKLYRIAFKAGLRGNGPEVCPNYCGGYKIPEMFEDGALAYGIWHQAYGRGMEVASDREAIANGYDI